MVLVQASLQHDDVAVGYGRYLYTNYQRNSPTEGDDDDDDDDDGGFDYAPAA